MEERLGNKVAIVTGGGSGIGAAIARRFANAGASVVVTGRRPEPIQAVAEETGGLAIPGDISLADICAEVVKKTQEAFGGLDIVAACAGILGYGSITDQTEETWDTIISINLTGVMQICRAAIPAMLERGGGAIVTISSTGGIATSPNEAAYISSKHGVVGLTRSIALDYGRQGIRANCICPGYVQTPMMDVHLPGLAEELGTSLQDAKIHMAKCYPLGRIGEPDEIAACAEFLASDDASFLTGVSLPADGGGHIVDPAVCPFMV